MFYCVDKTTGKRTSLQTTNRDEAQQLVNAKNQAERQPVLNLHIAKAYLAGADNGMTTRTWQHALDALSATKLAANQHRWRSVARDKALAPMLPRLIIDTPADHLLQAMQAGIQSELGKTYTVQYITAIGSSWQNLASVPGNGNVITVTNAAPGSIRFYRLVEQ